MGETDTLYQREVVGSFRSAEALEGVLSALGSAGWDRAEMSLLAQEDVLAPRHIQGSSDEIADDPESPRAQVVSDTDVRQMRTLTTGIAGVVGAFLASGAVILTGGTALAAVVGAAVAGGGAAAAVEGVGQAVDDSRKAFMDEQIMHGGILLWVLLHEPEEEAAIRDIMTRHGAVAIHVHDEDSGGSRAD